MCNQIRPATDKGPPQVLPAFIIRQAHLGKSMADSSKHVLLPGDGQNPGETAAQQARLVIASFPAAFRVQRHRNHKIDFVPMPRFQESIGHQRGQEPREIFPPVEFQAPDNAAQFSSVIAVGACS